MGAKKKKIITLLVIFIMLIGGSSYAHSGRTDSSGGHRDNKNKSGLGSYHYHCGGHPPHLHTNGVCPYSSSSSSSNKNSTTSNSTSSSTSKQTTSDTNKVNVTPSPKSNPIVATNIQINEKIKEIKIGESKQLTVEIQPNNTTNKNVTWKSSDKDIIDVSDSGRITAKKDGTATITVATSNGKTSYIIVEVVKDEKEDIILDQASNKYTKAILGILDESSKGDAIYKFIAKYIKIYLENVMKLFL